MAFAVKIKLCMSLHVKYMHPIKSKKINIYMIALPRELRRIEVHGVKENGSGKVSGSYTIS